MKLEELARLAGVSKATANIILSGNADRYKISKATRNRLMALVDKYQYMPDAGVIPDINSKQLAMILPTLRHHGFAMLADELEKQGREQGYRWLLFCSHDDPEVEKSILRGLAGQQIEAVASISCLWEDALYRKIEQQGIRTIFMDRRLPESTLPSITNDDQHAAYELTRLLLKQNPEPQPITYFGGISSMECSEKRLAGFNLAMSEAGFTEGDYPVFHKDYSVTAGYRLAEAFYQNNGQLPNNLFTASFTLMDGVLSYTRRHPEHLPENPNWATFGDSNMLDLMPFAIHSSRQEYEEHACKFFDLLKHKKQDNVEIARTLVDRFEQK